MMTTEQIRKLFTAGGSGECGIHGYLKVAECPELARLSAEQVVEGQQPLIFGRDAGTIFHALRERYHDHQEIDIPREDPEGNGELSQILGAGHEIFDFYKTYMPVGHIGEVQSQEQLLSALTPGGLPFAGKLDVVVRCAVPTEVPGLGEGLLPPGLYLWDDKTHPGQPETSGSMPNNVFTGDGSSLQFVGYHWLNRACGQPPFDGTLVHHIVKHRKTKTNPEGMSIGRSVVTVLLPPPTEEDYTRLFRFLRYADSAKKRATENEDYRYNLAACNIRFGACAFLANGRCSRGGNHV